MYAKGNFCPSVQFVQELWFVAREVNVARTATPIVYFNKISKMRLRPC